MGAKQREPSHEIDDTGSNVSGTRRITHEIDADFGSARSSAAWAFGDLGELEQRPSHIPTLPAPLGIASPRRAASSPTLRRALDAWEFGPSSDVSWLGSRVESMLEERVEDDPIEIAESSITREDVSAIARDALGGDERAPRVLLSPRALTKAGLRPFEAFLLSFVDGVATVEDIVDMSGTSEHEALRVLLDLRRRGIIS